MPSLFQFLLLVGLAVVACQDDPLVRAIRQKTTDQLRDICTKASIACPEDADRNTLAGLVYEHAQKEVPIEHRKPIKPWPGLDDEGAGPSSTKDSSSTAAPDLSGVASMLFKSLDKDKDGKLAKAELQPIIDSTNQAAKAKGEAEIDLFSQLDVDRDGSVSRSEAEGFFSKMAYANSPGAGARVPSAAGGGKQDIASMLFSKLDTDRDGMLSREEMSDLLAASDAQAKQRGEAPQDFFATLDADGSGKVDQKEAEAFFKEMVNAGLMEDTSGKGLKDEV